jgi:hypothetical protein
MLSRACPANAPSNVLMLFVTLPLPVLTVLVATDPLSANAIGFIAVFV